MIKMLVQNFQTILNSFIEQEKLYTQMKCLINDKNNSIYHMINTFKRKHRNYARYIAYDLAYPGYKLNIIIDELNKLKGILK